MADTDLQPPQETETESARREKIAARKESSVFWGLVHFLGSLNLALVLLALLALACAAATIAESNFNTKVAQAYIYKNPLFVAWLVLLCVNLFCVTLTRIPWQRKHAGFIITHYGIITLLAGAMIGRSAGYEAFITLEKGEEPKSLLTTNDPILFLENPVTGTIGTAPFETEVKKPSPEKPRIFPVDGTPLRVVVDQVSDKLSATTKLLDDPVQGIAPGVQLRLHSASLNQTFDVPLLQTKEGSAFDMFGLAKIEWLEQLPPLPDAKSAAPKDAPTYRESQMIFARQPDIPIIHNTNGTPAGYRFALIPKKEAPGFDLEIIFPNSQRRLMDLQEAMKKPIPGERPPVQIVVAQYWPDLRMVDGKPVSASKEPNNPAALITYSGLIEDPAAKKPRLLLAPDGQGRVQYQIRKGESVSGKGTLNVDSVLETGWNDWTVELKTLSAKARLISEASESAGVLPGIRVFLRDQEGKESTPQWILKGSSETLSLDGRRVRLGFGNRVIPIPFGVALTDFQVPRDEGTSTPANFISTIQFYPGDGSSPITGHSEMNSPASYPPGFLRQLTGDTYKFSQAGWNPQNLNETTLQVLHDPGWLLKWSGSLMICAGIFIMFYLKPSKKQQAETTAPATA